MSNFDDLAVRLEEKVYTTAKGLIRLSLIKKDLEDYVPGYREGGLRIDDIGGGSGNFAEQAVKAGHHVRLFDNSARMLELAHKRRDTLPASESQKLEIHRLNYLEAPLPASESASQTKLTCLHGSAEWMNNTAKAIKKAAASARPDSYISLLVFNSDRQLLKQGINGQLLPETKQEKPRRLTPPGGLSPLEIIELLKPYGTVLLQSGIRVFHDFFRQFDPGTLSSSQWLAQEEAWYRKEPFRGLGEHTHIIFRKSPGAPEGSSDEN